MKILVDSREKNAIPFKVEGSISEVTVRGLPFGDYWAEWEPGSEAAGYNCEMPIAFERKSLSDLFGTLSNKENYQRFKREMQRANENKVKLVLVIEGTISEVIAGVAHCDRKGSELLKQLFTLWMKYDLIPVFCPNRSEMRRFMTETFEAIGRNFKPEKKHEEKIKCVETSKA